MFPFPQSRWMRWVPRSTACIQGAYVVYSSNRIQWGGETYLLRGEMKWLVVEWPGTLVQFRHSYNNYYHFNSYGGSLELRLSLHSAVQTRDSMKTLREKRRNCKCIWVSARSTRQLHESLRIFVTSWLPFIQLLQNLTLEDIKKQLLWRNNISTIERV